MGFDDIDKRFAKPKPIELEDPKEGDLCPDPDCDGILVIGCFGAAEGTYQKIACPRCGARFGATCP